jgi:alpha,alpha-trehalase
MANRYVSSVFCSWYATGGSIPGLLPRLPDSILNLTYSVNDTGRMFEKVSMLDIDVAGSGGEYVGKFFASSHLYCKADHI